MKVIKPTDISAAMLTSTTALELAPAAYSAGTSYAAGSNASVAGAAGLVSVYQSLQAGNAGHPPASSPSWWRLLCTVYQAYSGAATYALGDRVQDNVAHLVYQSAAAGNIGQPLADPTKWTLVGANNRWAMFDAAVGTATAVASPLAVVLRPGSVSGIGLMELVGRQATITMKDAPGGTIIYSRTIDLDGSVVESVYDWFFAEFEQRSDIAFTDLPGQFESCELALSITASSGSVACGVCKPGRTIAVGRTLAKPQVSIIDYSVKATDAFGATTIVERSYRKRATFQVLTEKFRFNGIYRALASLRATPAVYVGAEELGYEPLLLYGFFPDFTISVEYPDYHLCSLEVEGLI
ncbi:hypothetical protein [Rhodoferax sp. WC2427]|uniref:hypothetical protein n=1 Tax=Rhodoferax sp. WC2427 TaxID=3234144 RepID=UPI0034653BCD